MISERIHVFEDTEVEDQYALGDIGTLEDDFIEEENEEDDVNEQEFNNEYEVMSTIVREGGNNAGQDPRSSTNGWLSPEPPECHRFMGLTTCVNRDGTVYVRDIVRAQQLIPITISLAEHYKDYSQNETITDWTPGQSCVVYDSRRNLYLRSIIKKVDTENRTCTVEYIDYGNINEHVFEDLRRGTPTRHIPALAQTCSIYNLNPVGGTWTGEAIDYMNEHIVGRVWDIRICGLVFTGQSINFLIDLVGDAIWASCLPRDLVDHIYYASYIHHPSAVLRSNRPRL
ncbi:RING finger protein 17-like [Spodoptera litura]|uniref:RING finger protein 17-like n=1 Tax=Spodoptera litura TaxID=69820 RepID=A0A9J7ER64_SPOLT|nr:RING finger protein 17-like [Spodoptera litura]